MPKTEESYTCSDCGKSFEIKRYLVKHEKRMHSENSKKKEPVVDLKCSMCGKAFPRLSHLQRHQLTHLNIREWQCPFCSMQFVQKPHLIRHVSRFHPTENIANMTNIINSLKNKESPGADAPSTSLDSTSVSSEFCGSLVKYYLCFRCGQMFDNRYDLNRHLRNTHKPLVCHHCNMIFYGNEALKVHELKTRYGFYTCQCGSSFNKKDTFKRHKDACSGKGTFVCMECGQVFVQRIQFDRHYKKDHFKNAKCSQCDNWVAESPISMNRHMKHMHDQEVCGFCGQLDPEKNHIFTSHWKRLKKPVSLSKKMHVSNARKGSSLEIEKEELEEPIESFFDNDLSEKEQIYLNDSPTEERIFLRENQYELIMSNTRSAENNTGITKDSLQVDSELAEFSESELFEKASSNTMNAEVVLNVILSVPNMNDEVNLADRLPAGLVEDFPDLRSAVVLFEGGFSGKRFLNLNIPLLPPPGNVDISKWLEGPIHV